MIAFLLVSFLTIPSCTFAPRAITPQLIVPGTISSGQLPLLIPTAPPPDNHPRDNYTLCQVPPQTVLSIQLQIPPRQVG